MTFMPNDYFQAVPPSLRQGLAVGEVVSIVRKHYCPAILKISKCTTECTNCTLHIRKIIEDVQDFPNPRNRYALMVYKVRDYVSKVADATEVVTVKENRDWLGQKIESNPFELALQEL